MGARYVPIVFVADGDKAFEVVQKMTNAFHELDNASDQTSKGGLRNAFIQADLTSRAIAAGTREIIEAAKEYLQFGKELSNLNTLLGDNDSITRYRDGLLDLDPALGQTSELTRGMYQAISSGVESADALDAITASAKAARAGMATTFETVDAGTSVMASFGKTGKDLTSIYDKMFEVVKRGKVEMPQLAQSIGLVSNISAQAGISMDEMFAAIATSSRTNRPSIAIEGFRTAITNIIQPSQEAKKLAQELGIEFDASALRAKGFAKFLDEVQQATGGDIDKLSTLFGNVQGLSFILSITGNQAKTFANDLKGVAAASGTVDEAFKKQQESISAQWATFKVSIQQGLMKALLFVEPVLRLIIGLLGSPAFKVAALAIAGLTLAYRLWNSQLVLSAATYIPQLISNLGNIIRVMFSFRQVTSLSTTGLLSFAAGWLGVGSAILVGGYALVKWLFSYETAVENASKVTLDQVKAQGQSYTQNLALAKSMQEVAGKQSLSTEEHQRLNTVIASLNPATQTYIGTLGDEKKKVEEVTRAINEKIAADKSLLEAHAVTFAQAIIESTNEISKQTEEMNFASAQADVWREKVIAHTASVADANFYIGYFSKRVEDASTKIDEQNKTLAQNAVKMVENAKALGLNHDGMMAFYRDAGYNTTALAALHDAWTLVTPAINDASAAIYHCIPGFNLLASSVDNTAASVRGLKGDLADLARIPQQKIDSVVLDIVRTAKNKGEARHMAQEAMKNDPALNQAVQENRRIKETTEGARGQFEPSSRGGGGGRGGGVSRRANAEDSNTQYVMKQLDLQVRASERAYKEEITAAQRAYEQRNISLAEFTNRQIAWEESRTVATINLLNQELAEAKKIHKGRTRDLKVAEVNEKILQAESDKNLAIQKINDNATKVQLDSLREQGQAKLAILEIYDERANNQIRDAAQLGTITAEAAEIRTTAIKYNAFQRRMSLLFLEMVAAGANAQELAKITNEKRKSEEEFTNYYDESLRRRAVARHEDVENARKAAAELSNLQAENLHLEQDISRQRIETAVKLGTLSEDDAKRAIAAQDVLTENLRASKERLDLIEQQSQKEKDLVGKSPEYRAQVDAAFRSRALLLEQQHQDKLNDIRIRPLLEYRAKVENVANSIADVFGNAFDSIFDKGKSFWKSLEDGFKQMFQSIVRDFIKSKVKEAIMSLFKPKANDESESAHSSGGGFSLSNIFGGGGGNSSSGGGGGGGGLFGTIRNLFGSGGNSNAASGQSGGLLSRLGGFLGIGGGGAASAASGATTASTIGASSFAAPSALGLLAGGGAATAASGAGLLTGGASAFAAPSAIAAVGGSGGAAAGAGAAGGSSAFSGLVPFLTNPWTIGIAAAAIGGLLLWRHFRHGTEKKLQSAIKSTYSIDVKDNSILKQIKTLGDQGYGSASKHIQETIALEPVKELLSNYAQTTGQKTSLTTDKQLSDPSFKANQFQYREFGGPVEKGMSYVVGERRAELFVPDESGFILPSVPQPVRTPKPKGSAQASSSSASGSSQKGSQGSSIPTSMIAALIGALGRVHEVMDGFEAEDENALFKRTLKKNSRAVADAVNTSLGSGYRKPDMQRNLNLG